MDLSSNHVSPESGLTDSSGRTSLVFSIRGPIPIQLDENMSSWSSGASVLDLIFPQPETVSEIRFRNWYTARLSLLVRFDDSAQAPPKREHLAWAAAASLSLARLRGADTTEGISIGRNLTSGGRSPSDWVVSIQNKQLMIDPHCETGSQDVVVISAASESLITLHEVTALRFLLRQPSPNWKNFNINGITVYRSNIPGSTNKSGSRISSAVLHQHAMTTRNGRGGTASGSLSPSTAVSPLTLSPSSSMALSAELSESAGEILGGSNEPGSRRSSFFNGGSAPSKEEQEDRIFRLLQRQTTFALKGEKLPPVIKQDDNNISKGKHNESSNLPSSYDVATLQFS